jgi:hypothetical protein
MCEIFIRNFLDCMKEPKKEIKNKCKKEFEAWDNCYKKTYWNDLSYKIKTERNVNGIIIL